MSVQVKVFIGRIFALMAFLVLSVQLCAQERLPMLRPAHVAVVYDKAATNQINRFHNLQIQLNDIYTGEEKEIKLKQEATGIFVAHFVIYHPLYSVVTEAPDKKYPIYVEPGDYLIITIGADGSWTYMQQNGEFAKCENLLKHDVSNNIYYGEMDFIKDKSQMSFTDFSKKIMGVMSDAMLEVSAVANSQHFTEYERNLALVNVKMQMARWLFRFVPCRGEKGEQPKDVKEDEKLPGSYDFIRSLPMTDSLCVTSPYFPDFIKRFENTYMLNYEQYKYVDAIAAMDSDFIAKEKVLTRRNTSSQFMDVAMLRRRVSRNPRLLHVDPKYGEQFVDTTGSIVLREVKVFSTDATPQGLRVTKDMQLEAKLGSASPNANLLGFTELISKHKKKKKAARVKKVLDSIDDGEMSERERLEKAYEETTGRKVEDR